MTRPWPDFSTPRADDYAACRTLLRGGSKSFYAASLFLPHEVREPATALYAFCRMADDQIDLLGGRGAAISELHERLERVFRGQPDAHPIDRSLARTVDEYDIPPALLRALIEGLQWDAQGRRYDDVSDLYAYAARVAGTVGVLMAVIMRRRAPETLARACDLGVAMQLTNIARDVGEDARAGRVYLPLAWMTEAGIDVEAWLADPQYSPQLGGVVQRLLDQAEFLYRRAESGIAQLPAGCRPGIHAARLFYREIGKELERRGLDSVSQRVYVPAVGKMRLIPRVLRASASGRLRPPIPPLAEVRFLINAVVA